MSESSVVSESEEKEQAVGKSESGEIGNRERKGNNFGITNKKLPDVGSLV